MSVSEMYDVARKAAETMEGKCEPQADAAGQTGTYRWCSWHRSQWQAGHAVCVTMQDHILLAEQAIEDAGPIIRADEREKWKAVMPFTDKVKRSGWERDLRAKVEALEIRQPWGPAGTDVIARADVLALLGGKDG